MLTINVGIKMLVDTSPLTWEESCALQICNKCPKLNVTLPIEAMRIEVIYSVWDKKEEMMLRKGSMVVKEVYGLQTKVKSLQELMDEISQEMPSIKRHVYVANKQWYAHKHIRQVMTENTLLTVEDYQMNIVLES